MPYTLTEIGCEESFSEKEQSITRTFHVNPWGSRAEFLAAVLGGVELIGGRLFRIFPHRDPEYRWLWAKTCKFKPLDEDPGLVAQTANLLAVRSLYQTAVATVTYAPLDNDQGDSNQAQQSEQQEMDLATVGWDFSARNLTLPNTWMVYTDAVGGVNDGAVANSNMAAVKIYPGLQVVVTRHLVARKPFSAILGNLGRINKSKFFIGGDEYPPETLRFDSAKASKKWTSKGQKYYELTYTFACQPIYDQTLSDPAAPGGKGYVGWNRIFDPRKGYWRYIRTNTGGPTHYLYELDEDGPSQTLNGRVRSGFPILFNPAAA